MDSQASHTRRGVPYAGSLLFNNNKSKIIYTKITIS